MSPFFRLFVQKDGDAVFAFVCTYILCLALLCCRQRDLYPRFFSMRGITHVYLASLGHIKKEEWLFLFDKIEGFTLFIWPFSGNKKK